MAGTSGGQEKSTASTVPQSGPQPRTARGQQTRDKLLVAAREVFETKGYVEARVTDICDEAGLANGTFYLYFQSKDEIFYTLVDTVVADRYLLTAVPEDFEGSVADRFAYTLRQYFAAIQRNRKFSRIIEQVATLDERMRENRMAIRRTFRERIQHGIESLQRHGAADPTISAELTAEAIVSMVSNFAYINLSLGAREDLDIEQAVATLTSIWQRALALDVEKADANDVKQASRRRRA